MYLHRPDSLSLAFGILFTVVGLTFLIGGQAVMPIGLLVGLLGLAAGVGILGSLLFGDVHRWAARRLDARVSAPAGPRPAPPATPLASATFEAAEANDPLFGHPIHPDDLDQAFRETFGDDVPPDGPAAAEVRETHTPASRPGNEPEADR